MNDIARIVRVRAHWIGPVDVDIRDVTGIDPQWLSGALGYRIDFRNENWIAVSPADAQRVQDAMTEPRRH
jgi:hypothetical protein